MHIVGLLFLFCFVYKMEEEAHKGKHIYGTKKWHPVLTLFENNLYFWSSLTSSSFSFKIYLIILERKSLQAGGRTEGKREGISSQLPAEHGA